MVKNEKITNDSLYENMIKLEKEAYNAQDLLLNSIKKWISKVIEEDEKDFTKIVLVHGGSIEIRTVADLSDNILSNFVKEFGFKILWKKEENMVDFGNIEPVEAKIFVYSFIPKNIEELLGDNQVDLDGG